VQGFTVVELVLQVEIEKVKKRREQREAEKAQMEEELNLLQRERAIAEGHELDKKEEEVSRRRRGVGRPFPCCTALTSAAAVAELIDGQPGVARKHRSVSSTEGMPRASSGGVARKADVGPVGVGRAQFHLDQARMRTQQRLQEGRAKPIDIVAKNLFVGGEIDVDVDEPYTVFNGLTLHEVQELVEDIQTYQACRRLCSHSHTFPHPPGMLNSSSPFGLVSSSFAT
jgi:Conserved mid region of cactin